MYGFHHRLPSFSCFLFSRCHVSSSVLVVNKNGKRPSYIGMILAGRFDRRELEKQNALTKKLYVYLFIIEM